MMTKTVVDCVINLLLIWFIWLHAQLSWLIVYEFRFKGWLILPSKILASSYATPYHTIGNSQCEKTNHTAWKWNSLISVWKNIKLVLQQQGWQDIPQDALHAMQLLLCTTTNVIPHERIFCFLKRATFRYCAHTKIPMTSWYKPDLTYGIQ